VPLEIKESTKELSGLKLKNVLVLIYNEDKKLSEEFGEFFFTDFGVDGSVVLKLSRKIKEEILSSELKMKIDLKPALTQSQLHNRILREIKNNGSLCFNELMKLLLPQKFIKTFVNSSKIDKDKRIAEITKNEREKTVNLLKGFEFTVTKTRPLSEAIITSGGVELNQIYQKTMESKIVSGLYFTGEVLDIDGDTGGYNLQAAFSKLPRLTNAKGDFTKDALVLIYLVQDYPNTKKISKGELTQFIRQYYPDVNDVQQARHLGAQKGWFIAAGGRDNRNVVLTRGEYKLITLKKPYPAFHGHRIEQTEDWEELKKRYRYRCATCGSIEGEPNIHWPNTITRLQKAHINPNLPLEAGNIIPQCQKCNRADRNNWVYDERGRVIKLSNPNIIKRSDEEIRWKVYKILYEEFKGVNPNE